jgi:hypothetical protein
MTDSLRFRFRLPHWGWCLLLTVAVVIAGISLSIWLPYYHERLVINRIVSWGGGVQTQKDDPAWVRDIVGEARMQERTAFKRATHVDLAFTEFTDAESLHLGSLKNLNFLDLSRTQVSDAALVHLAGLTNPPGTPPRRHRGDKCGTHSLKRIDKPRAALSHSNTRDETGN